MKRSEALRIIRDYLTDANPDDRYCGLFADDDANGCLTALEEAGMLPPMIKNPNIPDDMSRLQWGAECAKQELYNYNYLPDEYDINEWEKE